MNKTPFFGIAIGGSLGATKENMHHIVKYTRSRIREDRPIHLLGIGGIRDIFHGNIYVIPHYYINSIFIYFNSLQT